LPKLSDNLKFCVKFIEYIPHQKSLSYMLGAHSLLLLLASNTAAGMVTGKVFEYIGSQKPILALIPKHVAAFQLLQKMPNCFFADPDDVKSIKQSILSLLEKHFDKPTENNQNKDLPEYLVPFSRIEQTRQLATLLNQVSKTN